MISHHPTLVLIATVAWLFAGCAMQADTVASIPTAMADYDRVFDAAADLVTRAGYNLTRTEKASGTISGVKQIGGDSLHFNILVKHASESAIDVTLIRGGGLLPTAVWKADARHMLRNLAQTLNVPESKIMVTFGDERKPLDQL